MAMYYCITSQATVACWKEWVAGQNVFNQTGEVSHIRPRQNFPKIAAEILLVALSDDTGRNGQKEFLEVSSQRLCNLDRPAR